MDCLSLDDQSHALLREVWRAGFKHKPAKDRVTEDGEEFYTARLTADSAAAKAGVPRGDVRELLEDLATNGYLVFFRENSAIAKSETSKGCTCEVDVLTHSLSETLGSDADRPRTHSKRSAEGGSGRDAGSAPKEQGLAHAARERGVQSLSTGKVRRKRESALDKPPEKLTAWDLAFLLGHRLREVGREDPAADTWVRAGAVAVDPLRTQIAAWIREDGVPPETIREMIENFVNDPRLLARPVPAWKTFVAERARLEHAVVSGGDVFTRPEGAVVSRTSNATWADVQRRQRSNTEH